MEVEAYFSSGLMVNPSSQCQFHKHSILVLSKLSVIKDQLLLWICFICIHCICAEDISLESTCTFSLKVTILAEAYLFGQLWPVTFQDQDL